jgi:nitrous oxidase accessory protein NosD
MRGFEMSRNVALVLVIALLAGLCRVSFFLVNASSRTIIVPDDYPTIMTAIGNATDSDTIFVKNGIYNEQELVINKTLSLIGESANSTKIILHPPLIPHYFWGQAYSDPIKIDANDVAISGFTISTEGGGMFVAGNGARIIGNIVGMGITVTGYETKIMGNVVPTILLRGFNQIIAQNTIGGIYVNWTGGAYVSLWIEDSVDNIIAKNKLSGGVGIELRSSTRNQIVANAIVSSICVQIDEYFGTSGLQTRASDNNIFYQNNFISNSTSIDQAGYHTGNYSVDNVWDNGEKGNYWSDYVGEDKDSNGVGDVPYIIDSNNQDHYPLMIPVDISTVTIPLPAVTLPWPSPLPSASPSLPPKSSPLPSPMASPSENPKQSPQPQPEREAFPIAWVAAVMIAIAVVGAGLLVFFKKHKH